MYLTQTQSKVGILPGHANRVLMAHKMKVEKRKLDQALTKMLRAKPEPRKKIRTQVRRGAKTPILAKP